MTYPWKSKTKQRMVFWMIHVKDSLLPMGKVWSLDFLGYYKDSKKEKHSQDLLAVLFAMNPDLPKKGRRPKC